MLMLWLCLRLGIEEKYLQAPLLDPENMQETTLFLLQSPNHLEMLCQHCFYILSPQT